MIWIQGQPERHFREPIEVYHLSLSGHTQQHISTKHEMNKYYRILYEIPTIHKAGEEYAKQRQHRYALFVMWKTQMTSTGNVMPSPAENVFSGMLMTLTSTKY